MRRFLAALGAVAIVAACGGSTAAIDGDRDAAGAEDGTASDGTTTDGAAGTDAPPRGDASSADASADAVSDAVSDAGQDVVACTGCLPDFCGCGLCTNEQVVCTKTPKPCPLGCVSSCDLKEYTCGCAADRCVRLSPAPPPVVPCYTTLDCPPGDCCVQRSGVLQGACVPGNNCP
jgi:hypothetical protein